MIPLYAILILIALAAAALQYHLEAPARELEAAGMLIFGKED